MAIQLASFPFRSQLAQSSLYFLYHSLLTLMAAVDKSLLTDGGTDLKMMFH